MQVVLKKQRVIHMSVCARMVATVLCATVIKVTHTLLRGNFGAGVEPKPFLYVYHLKHGMCRQEGLVVLVACNVQ